MSLFLICFRRSSRKSADGRRQEFNVQHRCRTRRPDKAGVVLRESPARHELVSDSCFGRSTRCESEKLGRAYRRRRGVSGRQTRGKIYDQEDGLHTGNPDFNA